MFLAFEGLSTAGPAGAYIFHALGAAGATGRLAQLSARAAPLFDALGGGLRQAMAGAQEAAQPVIEKVRGAAERIAPMVAPAPAPAPPPAPLTITATLHAQGMSAADIADELERRGRDAQAGSLFDAPHSYGQYGGA
jgi:phage-related baseplate assembly protein